MDTLALAAAFAIMGAIITALLALYQATASPRSDMERRLGSLLGETTGAEMIAAGQEALRTKRGGRLPILGSLLEGKSSTNEIAMDLERADLKLTPSEFLALRLFMAFLGAAMALLFAGAAGLGLVIAAGAGFIFFLLPKIYLGMKKGGRLKKLNEQLPEMLSMLANSLKAGFGLMQAMDLSSRELAHPIGTEMRRVMQDINVGAQTDEALQNMARRAGSSDLDIVVTAMLIQQSTGGNLAEILDNVAHTMRERIRIRGEIKTLTTQQMATGFVIGGLPVIVAVMISLINPGYINLLFTTTIGFIMLGAALMLELFGMFLIKRILAIEV